MCGENNARLLPDITVSQNLFLAAIGLSSLRSVIELVSVNPIPQCRRNGRRVMRHAMQCARLSSTIDQIKAGTMASTTNLDQQVDWIETGLITYAGDLWYSPHQ
jgi:hypothetical protein